MSMRVDFYFGPGSRYAYLASTQLDAVAARTGARFRWRPLFSADLMRAAGLPTLGERPQTGQYDKRYRETDVRRWAAFYGVPYCGDPDVSFEQWRGMALALCAVEDAHIPAFARAIYAACFERGAPPVTQAALAALAASCGAGALSFAQAGARSQAILADALASGVFGVPTFIAGGDLFFGNDRLPILEHHLKTKAAA